MNQCGRLIFRHSHASHVVERAVSGRWKRRPGGGADIARRSIPLSMMRRDGPVSGLLRAPRRKQKGWRSRPLRVCLFIWLRKTAARALRAAQPSLRGPRPKQSRGHGVISGLLRLTARNDNGECHCGGARSAADSSRLRKTAAPRRGLCYAQAKISSDPPYKTMPMIMAITQ